MPETFSLFDVTTKEGFERLYRVYASKIYQLCISKVRSREEAEEIVQELFKSIWIKRYKIRQDQPIENYLYRAAKYKIIDHYRQIKRRKSRSIEIEYTSDLSKEETEEMVLLEDLKSNLITAFRKLPRQAQQIFWLSRKSGLTNKEVALKLAVSEKTVEYHMRKTLKLFKKELT
ncbi:MAG: sigma-70 family RNA polymerase sigma factor [Bacteroidota bacterium]